MHPIPVLYPDGPTSSLPGVLWCWVPGWVSRLAGGGGAEAFLGQPPLPVSQEFVFPHLPLGFCSPGLVGMDLEWADGSWDGPGNSQAESAKGVFYQRPEQFIL